MTSRLLTTDKARAQHFVRVLAALLAAVGLLLALSFGVAVQAPDTAWAAIYSVEESQQAATPDNGDSAADGEQIADDETPMASGVDEESDEEQIEDDETPMSDGLGAAEPIAGEGLGIGTIALIGIIAVLAFFLVITRRLNSNIKDMRRTLR